MKIDWTKVKEGCSLMQTLEKENKQLKDQLQQKENIVKEVREYVKQLIDLKEEDYLKSVSLIYIEKILEILDREEK